MSDDDYVRKLDEIDRLLNDPDVPMQPVLIWRLLAEISEHDLQAGTMLSQHVPPQQSVPKWGADPDHERVGHTPNFPDFLSRGADPLLALSFQLPPYIPPFSHSRGEAIRRQGGRTSRTVRVNEDRSPRVVDGVLRRHPDVTLTPWQDVSNTIPLIVA